MRAGGAETMEMDGNENKNDGGEPPGYFGTPCQPFTEAVMDGAPNGKSYINIQSILMIELSTNIWNAWMLGLFGSAVPPCPSPETREISFTDL